jgi:hypothetical protein|tara:strand:+ start:7041 stop:7619 length:579 start_codon:yes stop_codon:yes gene_type:complete
MKIKVSRVAEAGIYGSTVINHRIKHKLEITGDEYIVLEYIYNMNKDANKVTAYGDMDNLWKSIGMYPPEFGKFAVNLIDKGFIEESHGLVVTNKWINEFVDVNKDKFEEFWEVYGRIGNKEQARKMFLKAVKEIYYKDLLEKHAKYVKHLENTEWKGKMHCSTWLNPVSKRYNDEYELEEKQEDNREEKFQM